MGCHYTKKKRKNGRASRAANFRLTALRQCRTVIRPLCLCAAIAKTTLACQGVKQGHDRISLPHARVGLACAKVAGLLCAWWPVDKKKGGHCVSRDRRMKIAESVASWKICLFTLYSCWQMVRIRITVWILAPEKARRRKAWNNFLSGRDFFFLHFCLIDECWPSRPFCWKAPGGLHFLNRFYPPNKMLALQSSSGWQRATRPSTNVPRVAAGNKTVTTGPPTCCGRILSTRGHQWL